MGEIWEFGKLLAVVFDSCTLVMHGRKRGWCEGVHVPLLDGTGASGLLSKHMYSIGTCSSSTINARCWAYQPLQVANDR